MHKLPSVMQTALWVSQFPFALEVAKLMNRIKRIPLGDIIAERVLEARKGSKSHIATVRIGRPVKSANAPDYRCPYQIAGIGDDVVRSASGEDSMQAMELALKMVGAELYLRHKDFTFTWLGQADLGFPKPNLGTT